ncbi:auxin-responsive protein IAA17 [Lactuca sativa]|uniref:Auxin-responsive protein n=1 Tax=Lactuca sativa TaxID=4236 RepID=A0A9R1XWU0_LACSA|nr:auxin-responsive protein IAA17 [Lactuca sativa]KAJ0225439.1 hypothetical protein LSAT_V11C100014440 [Lactuca sativa]
MSSVTSEFAVTGGGIGVEFDEIELTLGLPGESRERKSGTKRLFSDVVDLKLGNCGEQEAIESDCECSDLDSRKPPSKGQVVGWPPVRSHNRKNTVMKSSNCKYVKVAVDGVPYLRKVDLKSYTGYQQLLCVFEDMFSCFAIGNRALINENKMIDYLNTSDHVPTYEDKDGDWMLVGDVPWKMFVETCRRIRLRKSSD